MTFNLSFIGHILKELYFIQEWLVQLTWNETNINQQNLDWIYDATHHLGLRFPRSNVATSSFQEWVGLIIFKLCM